MTLVLSVPYFQEILIFVRPIDVVLYSDVTGLLEYRYQSIDVYKLLEHEGASQNEQTESCSSHIIHDCFYWILDGAKRWFLLSFFYTWALFNAKSHLIICTIEVEWWTSKSGKPRMHIGPYTKVSWWFCNTHIHTTLVNWIYDKDHFR